MADGEASVISYRVSGIGHRFRALAVAALFAALLIFGTLPYAPARIREIKNRYGFTQAALEPFRSPEAQAMTPALVLVQTDDWKEYGVYLNLEDPYLTTPFIFAWASPQEAESLALDFPARAIYGYDPQEPGMFLGLLPP